MTHRWRAFWRGYHAQSVLRPQVLDAPQLLRLTAVVDASGESEVRSLVLAHHPDAVDLQVRWAPDTDQTPPGPHPAGSCVMCGTHYQGLGFTKLPIGPIELHEGLYTLTRGCVCRRNAREFSVRWPLPFALPWVRVCYRAEMALGEVIQRSRQRVVVRWQDGSLLTLRGNGQYANRHGLPRIHAEDLVRLPPKVGGTP